MGIGKTVPNNISGKQNYILAIGIDKYEEQHNFRRLQSCKREVNNFVKIALEKYQCFNENSYIILEDYKATKENILTEIKRQLYKSKASEWNLIIYFAGHGHFNTRTKVGYWIPYDAKHGKYAASYLSFEEIRKYIANSSIHHILLISDSCYGGTIFANYRNIPVYIPKNYTIPSRWGFTSGRQETVDDGTNRTPSPFSEVLSYILHLNAKTGNELSVRRLCSEVEDEFGRRHKENEQMPDAQVLDIASFRHNNGQFVFLPKHTSKIPLEVNGKLLNDGNLKEVAEEGKLKPINESTESNSKTDSNSPFEKPNPNQPKLDDADLELEGAEIKLKSNDRKRLFVMGLLGVFLFLIIGIWESNSPINPPKLSQPKPDNTGPSGTAILATVIEPNKVEAVINDVKDVVGYKGNSKIQTLPTYSDAIKRYKKKIGLGSESDTSKNNNIVFAGSFENKDNALNILSQLKQIGYQNSEIVMKQDLPYMTVVTGFNVQKMKAKQEVHSLQKQGIKAYHSERQADKIYRKKK